MSHVKCYEEVKQEPFGLSSGSESQHGMGGTEMETQQEQTTSQKLS